MNGTDLKAWRKRNGYNSQSSLLLELDVDSRTTISKWENSTTPLPRMLQLALLALELHPDMRVAFGEKYDLTEYMKNKRKDYKYSRDRKE